MTDDYDARDADTDAPARPRGRPKTMPDAARRAEIVSAARDLFEEGGYAAMTTEAVARRSRTSKRSIYEHFDDKADLFAAVVDQHASEMIVLPAADEDAPLDEAIARIFRVDIDQDSDRKRLAFLEAAFDQPQFPEVPAIIRARGIEASHRAVASWLQAQKDKGLLAFPDAGQAARVLMDMMFGAMPHRPGVPQLLGDDRERRQRQLYCIDVFLYGVKPR